MYFHDKDLPDCFPEIICNLPLQISNDFRIHFEDTRTKRKHHLFDKLIVNNGGALPEASSLLLLGYDEQFLFLHAGLRHNDSKLHGLRYYAPRQPKYDLALELGIIC